MLGTGGVVRLWLLILWDWICTVAREQFSALFRRLKMSDTTAFDRQAGDMVWSIVTGLYAGYSLPEVIQTLSETAPEPTATALKRLQAAGFRPTLEQGPKHESPTKHLEQLWQ
jgi:Flp pilus assembly protein TadB